MTNGSKKENRRGIKNKSNDILMILVGRKDANKILNT